MMIEAPVRAKHTYTQKLCAPPECIFPLLCPVREMEWAEGWNPVVVFSNSGIAEHDGVFITSNEQAQTVWMVTRYEPEKCLIEMVNMTPGVTVCRLLITLAGNNTGGTDAEIMYVHTAIGEAGQKFVSEFTSDYYAKFMREWEKQLNDYLQK